MWHPSRQADGSMLLGRRRFWMLFLLQLKKQVWNLPLWYTTWHLNDQRFQNVPKAVLMLWAEEMPEVIHKDSARVFLRNAWTDFSKCMPQCCIHGLWHECCHMAQAQQTYKTQWWTHGIAERQGGQHTQSLALSLANFQTKRTPCQPYHPLSAQ